jgi:glycosyltransferase involved in cell wall biosynthesis
MEQGTYPVAEAHGSAKLRQTANSHPRENVAVRRRIAIFVTHPIQYHAAWFRALAAHTRIDLEVLFAHQPASAEHSSAGFGVEFQWDIPLLNGYRSRFLRNIAPQPSTGRFNGLNTPEVAAIVAREKYDAVVVGGWHSRCFWQAIRACWRTGTPVIVRGDSHLHTARHPLKRVLKAPVYRWFLPRMDACLAVGSWSRDYYLHYGVRPERIFVAPHCIDEALFQARADADVSRSVELRRRWRLRADSVVFLFAAKFIPKKRPLDFVRAIAGLGAANVEGLMVGDGPLRPACEEFVSRHRLPVHFTGFLNQSQMVDAYVAADCLVLPSNGEESWGLVVNEAMSCSRPAVVSDAVGCAPDLVRDGRTGAVFPLGNVAALAKILTGLAWDPERLRAMGAQARAGLAPYSLAAAVQGVVDAVETVTSNRRTR